MHPLLSLVYSFYSTEHMLIKYSHKFLVNSLVNVYQLYCFIYFFSTVSRAKIVGNSEIFVKSGSDINLTCVAVHSPSPPSFIYWYKEGRVINYSQRGGISVLTERKTRTSKLVISKAMSSDSGNYTCIPSSSGKLASVTHSVLTIFFHCCRYCLSYEQNKQVAVTVGDIWYPDNCKKKLSDIRKVEINSDEKKSKWNQLYPSTNDTYTPTSWRYVKL